MMDWMRLALFPLIIISLALQGCASSAVSREASDQMDVGYQNANSLVDSISSGNLADTYANSTQAAKGVVIGGVAGGVAGATTTGVGALAGFAGGAILGGAFGAYLDNYTSVRDQLDNRGVKVIVLGDQVLIVIPSSKIFDGPTPNIRPGATQTMYLVSKMISSYPNMSVKVSGYTTAMGADRVNQSLSQQQAEVVAKYLWRNGVNTRLLYAAGYGCTNLVTKYSLDETTINNRIEIVLEKVPV